jgi:DNA invertase Pin-like site-specific DNA recombinase
LDKALAAARAHRVPLIVARVDRLTRSVAFLSRLLEAGVDVRFADLPIVEGATGRFLLQQMAAVAELEAGMISARTKAALAAAKRRGVKLGGDRGVWPTAKQRAVAIAARQEQADKRALDLAPIVKELQASGAVSLRAIAAGLDQRGVPAARGGSWSANQVARLLENIASPFANAGASAASAVGVA